MALIVRNIYKFILFFILNFLMFSFIYIYFNLEKSNFIFLFTRDWHTMSFVAETQSAPPPPPWGINANSWWQLNTGYHRSVCFIKNCYHSSHNVDWKGNRPAILCQRTHCKFTAIFVKLNEISALFSTDDTAADRKYSIQFNSVQSNSIAQMHQICGNVSLIKFCRITIYINSRGDWAEK